MPKGKDDKRFRNAKTGWSSGEELMLRNMADEGVHVDAICEALGRSPKAVQDRMLQLGVKREWKERVLERFGTKGYEGTDKDAPDVPEKKAEEESNKSGYDPTGHILGLLYIIAVTALLISIITLSVVAG